MKKYGYLVENKCAGMDKLARKDVGTLRMREMEEF
jgi:hypothetical protein